MKKTFGFLVAMAMLLVCWHNLARAAQYEITLNKSGEVVDVSRFVSKEEVVKRVIQIDLPSGLLIPDNDLFGLVAKMEAGKTVIYPEKRKFTVTSLTNFDIEAKSQWELKLVDDKVRFESLSVRVTDAEKSQFAGSIFVALAVMLFVIPCTIYSAAKKRVGIVMFAVFIAVFIVVFVSQSFNVNSITIFESFNIWRAAAFVYLIVAASYVICSNAPEFVVVFTIFMASAGMVLSTMVVGSTVCLSGVTIFHLTLIYFLFFKGARTITKELGVLNIF